MTRPFISVAIPAYDMDGFGWEFLDHSLAIVSSQSYSEVEVVVSDHSFGSDVRQTVVKWKRDGLNIRYYRNIYCRGNSSSNLNCALEMCTAKYIKILFQDDFLFSNNSLEKTVRCMERNPHKYWLVSASEHYSPDKNYFRPFYPSISEEIFKGVNTVSSPSVITIRNLSPLRFDENLSWLMDVEYYRRMLDTVGFPLFLNDITVVNRIGEHQFTNKVDHVKKSSEQDYVERLYGNRSRSNTC
jgi:glycosyltransferase involved in cell wall biosynthesis